MSSERPRSILERLRMLVSGIFSLWVRDREARNPRAVYEAAIGERVRQYRDLKGAVAGILYMRNKLEGEIRERRAELSKLHEDVRRGVRRGEDDVTLVLITRRQRLTEDLERAEAELADVRQQAEEAKGNLARFRDDIRALEREKTRTLATLANARARRRIREAFEGINVDGDLRALESVRELAIRLATEGRLEREMDAEGELGERVRAVREEAREEAARRELAELKRRLVPLVLPVASEPARNVREEAAVASGA
jgi:phage shock protein A